MTDFDMSKMTKAELIDRMADLEDQIGDLEADADTSMRNVAHLIGEQMVVEGPVWDAESRTMVTGNRLRFAQQFVINGYLNSLDRAMTWFTEKHDEARRRLQAELRADIGDELSAQKIARALDFTELRQDELTAIEALYTDGCAEFERRFGEKFKPWRPNAGPAQPKGSNRDELAKRLAAMGEKLPTQANNTDGVDTSDDAAAAG